MLIIIQHQKYVNKRKSAYIVIMVVMVDSAAGRFDDWTIGRSSNRIDRLL